MSFIFLNANILPHPESDLLWVHETSYMSWDYVCSPALAWILSRPVTTACWVDRLWTTQKAMCTLQWQSLHWAQGGAHLWSVTSLLVKGKGTNPPLCCCLKKKKKHKFFNELLHFLLIFYLPSILGAKRKFLKSSGWRQFSSLWEQLRFSSLFLLYIHLFKCYHTNLWPQTQHFTTLSNTSPPLIPKQLSKGWLSIL